MGLLLSNTEQNLETSGSHLRDVTLQVILSWKSRQRCGGSGYLGAPLLGSLCSISSSLES